MILSGTKLTMDKRDLSDFNISFRFVTGFLTLICYHKFFQCYDHLVIVILLFVMVLIFLF